MYEGKAPSQGPLNSMNIEELQRCFEQQEKRLDKYIDSLGEYFEGIQGLFVSNENIFFLKKKKSGFFWYVRLGKNK